MNILITGGAGYIGSHILKQLKLNRNHNVYSLDNLSTGNRKALLNTYNFEVDMKNKKELDKVFRDNHFDVIIHTASHASVSESIENPLKYYENNLNGSINLLKMVEQYNIPYFIFSSSAGVYGEAEYTPIDEDHLKKPLSPYGETKLFFEEMLKNYKKSNSNFNYCSLRYFNVAGADPDLELGQGDKVTIHLMKILSEVSVGKRKYITINGTDYNTRDGTCERDYIHVTDLSNAHISALDYLISNNHSRVFNIGYGLGFTVNEIISTFRKYRNFDVFHGQRRKGDPSKLIADNSRARKELHWTPIYNDIDFICKTALMWEEKLNGIKQ